MANGENLGAKFTIDVSDLKKGLATANKLIRESESEFKAAAAGMDDWRTSSEGLQAQIKKLTSIEDLQAQKVSALKSEYSRLIKEGLDPSSDKAISLRTQINNQTAALNKTQKELEGATKDLQELGDEGKKAGKNLKDASDGGLNAFTVALGNLAANAISAAISAMQDMISQTIEVGKTFEKSMSNVGALSGATAEEMQMLEDTAKKFGSTTQFSASEAADALSYMALAGWDANTSASALGGVLNLAAASGMDLASASDLVTDYMSAFGLEASQSAEFADMLAYAQANANTTVEGLGEAFKNCAANMNAAGQDVQTTTSFLAMLANQGLKGSEAGTALTAVMRDMTSKMKDGAIKIGETNVQVMDAQGNYRDLTDILKDVEKATNGMGDAEKAAALQSTFTSDSIKGLNLILNAGVDNAASFEDALNGATGTADEMATAMNDNLNGDLTALNSQLEGVQIEIYQKFEPALRAGVDVLGSLLDAVQFVVDHSTEFITALGAMAAGIAAYIGYTTALKVMKDGWTALTVVTKAQAAAQTLLNTVMNANPIGILIAAITALVAAFVMLWNNCESFRNFWIGLWENIKAIAEPIIEGIVTAFQTAWETIKGVWATVSAFFSQVWEGIKTVFAPVADFFSTLFGNAFTLIKDVWLLASFFFQTVWDAIKAIFEPVLEFFSGIFSGAWDAIKLIWDAVSGYFSSLWEGVKNIFSPVVNFFKNVFSDAWKAIKNVFNSVGSFFKGIWNTIKGVFTNIGQKAGDAIGGAFKSAINAVLRTVENVLNAPIKAINSLLGTINKVPGINLSKLDTFDLPRLAKGGVVRGATLAEIGEDGAEAIVPLENNTQWIRNVARQLKAETSALNNNSGNGNSTIDNNKNVTVNQTNYYSAAHSRYELYKSKQDTEAAVKLALLGV